jgi:hypothetical protein
MLKKGFSSGGRVNHACEQPKRLNDTVNEEII